MAKGFLDRASPPHIMTLVLTAATSAISMNVFLPSLPGMAVYFNADYAIVQLTVSAYLAATALLQLLIGPLSDRFGRRPVLLICVAVFMVGTVLSLWAPTIELLLVCRVLQAFSAAGIVLSRAIIRDMVGADEAASKIGYVTMGMTLAPMIGPIAGGYLDEIYGWQSTFVLMLAFGVVSFTFAFLDLGETNRHVSSGLSAQFKSYPQLFVSRRFWGYTLTAALTSGAFFAFLGGGPYVATQMLGMSPSDYGLYFALSGLGYMIGNFLSGRYARRIGINGMMLAGNLVATAGMVLAIILFASGHVHPIFLFGPVAFTGIGNGITLPSANAGAVSVRPHLAGSASGLSGALQIGGGAALSVLAGTVLSPTTGPYPLLILMGLSSLAAVLATLYVMHVDRQNRESLS